MQIAASEPAVHLYMYKHHRQSEKQNTVIEKNAEYQILYDITVQTNKRFTCSAQNIQMCNLFLLVCLIFKSNYCLIITLDTLAHLLSDTFTQVSFL